MTARANRRGLTSTEVLILVAVVGVLLGLALPAALLSREAARRAACVNNLKQLGLVFYNHYDARKQLPSAGTGWGATAGGWSFLVRVMPYYCNSYLKELPIASNDPGATHPGTAARLTAAMMCCYHCPSSPDDGVHNATASYKGIGATCIESLMVEPGSSGPSPAPLYGDLAFHPDGALFPGKTLTFKDFTDGLADTILCTETVDRSNPGSRWLYASDTILVGLPTGSQTGAVKFQLSPTTKGFYAPLYYENDGDGGQSSPENTNPTYKTYRTFLAFDFSRPPDADSYPSPMLGISLPAGYYGPSSGHPSVVNSAAPLWRICLL